MIRKYDFGHSQVFILLRVGQMTTIIFCKEFLLKEFWIPTGFDLLLGDLIKVSGCWTIGIPEVND
jgi:hypothetical protein